MREMLIKRLLFVFFLLSGVSQLTAQDVVIDIEPGYIVNKDLFGFGWNVTPSNMPVSIYPELEEMFVNSGQSWVRTIFYGYEWERSNDDNDAWTPPDELESTFRWSRSQDVYRLKKLLDICEENNIAVEINNWSTNEKSWINHELDPNGHVTKTEAEAKAEEFGENLAALLYYLKTTANNGAPYTCVKYYAIWNEPNGGYPGQDFISFDYPGYHNMLYNKVHEHLEYYDQQAGTQLLDELESIGLEAHPYYRNNTNGQYSGGNTWDNLVGEGILEYSEVPDGVPGEITDWPGADATIDYISIHDYNSVFDYQEYMPSEYKQGTIEGRLLPMVIDVQDQIETYNPDGSIEPLLMNELGSHALGKEHSEPKFEHMLYNVEVFARSVNAGLSGGSMWAFNEHRFYTTFNAPGIDWDWDEGDFTPPEEFEIVGENYYPYALLLKALKRGDHVMFTNVVGGEDNSNNTSAYATYTTQRVWVTASRSADDSVKILVINDSFESKNIEINITGLAESGMKYYITEADYSGIKKELFTQSGDKISEQIPARSVSTYVIKGENLPVLGYGNAMKETPGIRVSPNPVNERIELSFEGNVKGDAVYTMLNILGQIEESGIHKANNGTPLELDMSGYLSGIYLLQIKLNGHTLIKKIVKK